MGEFSEVVKIAASNGWLLAAAVILYNIWSYSTGRTVPLRAYLEMKQDRDFWREAALHGAKQVTTLVSDKELGLATLESIETHSKASDNETV
jgi:hypothetical protein